MAARLPALAPSSIRSAAALLASSRVASREVATASLPRIDHQTETMKTAAMVSHPTSRSACQDTRARAAAATARPMAAEPRARRRASPGLFRSVDDPLILMAPVYHEALRSRALENH